MHECCRQQWVDNDLDGDVLLIPSLLVLLAAGYALLAWLWTLALSLCIQVINTTKHTTTLNLYYVSTAYRYWHTTYVVLQSWRPRVELKNGILTWPAVRLDWLDSGLLWDSSLSGDFTWLLKAMMNNNWLHCRFGAHCWMGETRHYYNINPITTLSEVQLSCSLHSEAHQVAH